MAAVAAVLGELRAGERVLAGDDLYGGSVRLLERILRPRGVDVTYVDATDPSAVEAACDERVRIGFVETPSNPLQRIAPIRALARVLHARGARLVVDNTMLSPYLQRPLELGADVVVHSATKHLGGHGDVTAGIVVCADDAAGAELAFRRNAEGTALAPFEAWLLARGLRTLGVRLERAQATARAIAGELARHPLVRAVHYAGLASHPGRAVHEEQARGAGSVLALETGSLELSRALVHAVRTFSLTVSFGSVASSISLPCSMSHASVPAQRRAAWGLPADLVRLSIGIEDARDLRDDLVGALERAAALVRAAGPAIRSPPA
jgi:cystathionine beta-lyase